MDAMLPASNLVLHPCYVTVALCPESGQTRPYCGVMTRSNRPPRSDPGPEQLPYPGEGLGLPEHGPGSLAGLGRRLVALIVDWSIAYGLARLTVTFDLMTSQQFLYGKDGSALVLATWLVLGVLAVRLFQFTPGQFALGLRVASVDERLLVGLGRADRARRADRVRHTRAVRRRRRARHSGPGDRHRRRAPLISGAAPLQDRLHRRGADEPPDWLSGGARSAGRRASWRCRASAPWASRRFRPANPVRSAVTPASPSA